jgi:hypothetical protein
VEDDLEKKIAEFLTEVRVVRRVDRGDYFVSFLEESPSER